jgi:hypothetical protein
MWPFSKKNIKLNSDEVNFWMERGISGILSPNEQRVFDTFVYVRDNMTERYEGSEATYVAAWVSAGGRNIAEICVNCICDRFKNEPVKVFKDGVRLGVQLPLKVKKHLAQELYAAVKCLESRELAVKWPLPTKWTKISKKKGK